MSSRMVGSKWVEVSVLLVLIIRSTIGNRGLGWDLLPPGSPFWEVQEKDNKSGKVRTMVYAG